MPKNFFLVRADDFVRRCHMYLTSTILALRDRDGLDLRKKIKNHDKKEL